MQMELANQEPEDLRAKILSELRKEPIVQIYNLSKKTALLHNELNRILQNCPDEIQNLKFAPKTYEERLEEIQRELNNITQLEKSSDFIQLEDEIYYSTVTIKSYIIEITFLTNLFQDENLAKEEKSINNVSVAGQYDDDRNSNNFSEAQPQTTQENKPKETMANEQLETLAITKNILEDQLEFSKEIINSLSKSKEDFSRGQAMINKVMQDIGTTRTSINNFEVQKFKSQILFGFAFTFFALTCAYIFYRRMPFKQLIGFIVYTQHMIRRVYVYLFLK